MSKEMKTFTCPILPRRRGGAVGRFRYHCGRLLRGPQAQIAELGDMDKTTMVVTVDALERAGLAERRRSANDRRARIIAVTEKGAAMAGKSQAIVDEVHRDAIGSLPQQGRAALVEGLAILAQAHLATPVDSPAPVRRARQK
jgi:DNA-binding MarR family transcriptional regulator